MGPIRGASVVVRHSGAYLGTDKASGRRRSMYIITGPISKQAETRSRDRVPKPCREQAWPVQTVLEYVHGACLWGLLRRSRGTLDLWSMASKNLEMAG